MSLVSRDQWRNTGRVDGSAGEEKESIDYAFTYKYGSENKNDGARMQFMKAILVFKLVSGFLIVADQLSIRFGLDGSQRVVDDLLGCLIAGLIFYFYERHRLRRLRQQLHVIDLMNHHARNAL